MNFLKKVIGSLYGVAIGDAMGAPVEGWSSENIRERFKNFDLNDFLPVTNDGDPNYGKGYGRITDDTLITEALIQAYMKSRDHMDAYDYTKYLLAEIEKTIVWLPERQKEMPILDRIWWPEKYPYLRFRGNADPRSAGIGNNVNCGVAMYMMPVGAVNAGNPKGAYLEAADIGIAHNESFAVEAAAVIAAAYASGFGAGSTIDEVIQTSIDIARDGTKNAIIDTVSAVDIKDDEVDFISKVRQAIIPYDEKTDHQADDQVADDIISDCGKPSRISSIEELPVAIAALKYGNGDYMKTLHSAVFYGRDCDSIASMALGIFGAIYGIVSIPIKLQKEVDVANKRNFAKLAEDLLETAKIIYKKDISRMQVRKETMDSEY